MDGCRPAQEELEAVSDAPIWMDGLTCGGQEAALQDCPFSSWGQVTSCSGHTGDVGLICLPEPLTGTRGLGAGWNGERARHM